MKSYGKGASLSTKDQSKIANEKDRQQKIRRQVRLQIATIILVVVFLAGECAALIPVE